MLPRINLNQLFELVFSAYKTMQDERIDLPLPLLSIRGDKLPDLRKIKPDPDKNLDEAVLAENIILEYKNRFEKPKLEAEVKVENVVPSPANIQQEELTKFKECFAILKFCAEIYKNAENFQDRKDEFIERLLSLKNSLYHKYDPSKFSASLKTVFLTVEAFALQIQSSNQYAAIVIDLQKEIDALNKQIKAETVKLTSEFVAKNDEMKSVTEKMFELADNQHRVLEKIGQPNTQDFYKSLSDYIDRQAQRLAEMQRQDAIQSKVIKELSEKFKAEQLATKQLKESLNGEDAMFLRSNFQAANNQLSRLTGENDQLKRKHELVLREVKAQEKLNTEHLTTIQALKKEYDKKVSDLNLEKENLANELRAKSLALTNAKQQNGMNAMMLSQYQASNQDLKTQLAALQEIQKFNSNAAKPAEAAPAHAKNRHIIYSPPQKNHNKESDVPRARAPHANPSFEQ